MYEIHIYSIDQQRDIIKGEIVDNAMAIENMLIERTFLTAEERADFRQQLATENIAEIKTYGRDPIFDTIEITVVCD